MISLLRLIANCLMKVLINLLYQDVLIVLPIAGGEDDDCGGNNLCCLLAATARVLPGH